MCVYASRLKIQLSNKTETARGCPLQATIAKSNQSDHRTISLDPKSSEQAGSGRVSSLLGMPRVEPHCSMYGAQTSRLIKCRWKSCHDLPHAPRPDGRTRGGQRMHVHMRMQVPHAHCTCACEHVSVHPCMRLAARVA